MTKAVSILLAVVRAGVFLTLLVPLITAVDSWWTPLLSPDLDLLAPQPRIPAIVYPDVVLRSVCFRMLIEVLVVAWVPLAILEPRYRPRGSLLLWSTLAFVGVAAIVDLAGVHPARSLWSNLERMDGLESLLHLLAFFVVAGAVLDGERLWRRLFLASIGIAALVAVLVWLQWARVVPLHEQNVEDQWFRADARLGSPVFLAIYLQLHLFLAALFLLPKLAKRRWLAATPWVLVALLFYTAIYHTGTRAATFAAVPAGLAAIAVAALLQNPARRGVRRAAVLTFAAIGCLAVLVVIVWTTRPAFLWDVPGLKRLFLAESSINARLTVWDIAIQGFAQRPLLGWGQQNFLYVFDRLYEPRLWTGVLYWDHPHNVWLGWLVAGGLLGVTAYLVWFVTPLVAAWTRRGAWLSQTDRSALTGLMVGYGVFDLTVFDTLTTLLVLVSVYAWLHSGSIERLPRGTGRSKLRLPIALVTSVVLAALASQGFRHQLRTLWAAHRIVVSAAKPISVVQPSGRLRPTLLDTLPDCYGTIALREARKTAALTALEREPLPDILMQVRGEYPDIPKEEVNRKAHDYQVWLYDVVVKELEDEAHEEEQESSAGPTIETMLFLGMTLLEHNRPDDAVYWLERARDIGPKRQFTYYQLGNAYFAVGRSQDALEAYRHAWQLWPRNQDAKLRYCAAAARAHDWQLADKLVNEIYPAKGRLHIPAPPIIDAFLQNGGAERLLPLYQRVYDAVMTQYRKGHADIDTLLKCYTSLIIVVDKAGMRERTEQMIHQAMKDVWRFKRQGHFLLDQLADGKPISYRVEPGDWYLVFPPAHYRTDLLPKK